MLRTLCGVDNMATLFVAFIPTLEQLFILNEGNCLHTEYVNAFVLIMLDGILFHMFCIRSFSLCSVRSRFIWTENKTKIYRIQALNAAV